MKGTVGADYCLWVLVRRELRLWRVMLLYFVFVARGHSELVWSRFKGMCLANPALSPEDACTELKRLHDQASRVHNRTPTYPERL